MKIYKISDENGEVYCSSITRAASEIQMWVSTDDSYTDIHEGEKLAKGIRRVFKRGGGIHYIEHDLSIEELHVY